MKYTEAENNLFNKVNKQFNIIYIVVSMNDARRIKKKLLLEPKLREKRETGAKIKREKSGAGAKIKR